MSQEVSKRYAQRGVSASKEDVHNAIKNIDKGLFPKAFCKIVPDYLTNDDDYCLIMHADGAGTKSSLAYMYWKETGDISVWKGIAQDALIMNIDDLLCVGATDNIMSIQPIMGKRSSDTKSRAMFIAHELQTVAPWAVTGEKDAEDIDGIPVYQTVDYSSLVPLLWAALQEANIRIQNLENT